MPTTRRRRAQEVREALEPSLHAFFLTGSYDAAHQARGEGLRGFAGMAQLLLRWPDHAALWEAHQDELVEDWVRIHPGSRPAAWWRYSAPEPRRWITPGGLHAPHIPNDWTAWRSTLGIQREDATGARADAVESQATYLARHRLLSVAERHRLHADAFIEPEVIRPDADEDDPDPTLGEEGSP